MINKIKSKIFLIIMLSFSVMILSITLMINIINYSQSRQESYEMINKFNNLLTKSTFLKNRPNKPAELDQHLDNIYLKTTDFYIVSVKDDEVVQIVNKGDNFYSNKDIDNYTHEVINKNKKQGTIGNLAYDIKKRDAITTVIFMDNTLAQNRLKEMLFISIFIAMVCLVVIFFISKQISNLLIKPIEETLEKQKQFISDASHELKTPLAVICANTDTLKCEIGENKWISYIQSEVNNMDRLVNNLLSLARVERGETNSNELLEFDLSKLVQGTLMGFESLVFEKGIFLEEDIQNNLKIKGNSYEIKQVISILIDNALNHTTSGGKIVVQLKQTKNNTVIKVKNTGNPIPKDEREKIFERFYRSDKSRNREGKRYGLGLSIAKSIVEKHNGNIEADWQNGFTVFTVIL